MVKILSLKIRARFMRKLSFLLNSGISFIEAMHFIKEKEEKPLVKRCLDGILKRINEGQAIHKSFATHPSIVDQRSIRIIQNGEMTGSLAKNCLCLSEDLEIRVQNRNRLIGALMYPACILIFACLLVLGLLVFVFPKILSIIDSGDASLPLATRLLLQGSIFLKEQGLMITIFLLIISGTIIFFYKRSLYFRKKYQNWVLFIPIISKIKKLIHATIFARLLSLFLESGYTLSESLGHARDLETNLVYQEVYMRLLNGAQKGNRFSKLLLSEVLLPSEIQQFSALGEESGNLSKTLMQAALIFEEDLREIEKRFFSFLEPALMVFLGFVVGFIALSLLGPIYSLTSTISQTTQNQ